jgi:hypothetical protein
LTISGGDVMFLAPFPESIALRLPRLDRMRRLASAAGLLALLALWPLCAASAQEHVLRFHHFMPEKSPQQLDIYQPWAERIAKASQGRLKIEVAGGHEARRQRR